MKEDPEYCCLRGQRLHWPGNEWDVVYKLIFSEAVEPDFYECSTEPEGRRSAEKLVYKCENGPDLLSDASFKWSGCILRVTGAAIRDWVWLTVLGSQCRKSVSGISDGNKADCNDFLCLWKLILQQHFVFSEKKWDRRKLNFQRIRYRKITSLRDNGGLLQKQEC